MTKKAQNLVELLSPELVKFSSLKTHQFLQFTKNVTKIGEKFGENSIENSNQQNFRQNW